MFARNLSHYLRRLLTIDDSPERVALAFSVGVFLAFSPLLGLHTFLGLTLAFLFGLNRVAILIGVFVNNPWTLVPIYAAGTYIGGLLFGFPGTSMLPHFAWRQIFQWSFWLHTVGQWSILKPLVLGSMVLAVGAALLSYPIALYMIHRGRSVRAVR